MATTARGIVYPASTDAPRVWEDMQTLAESVDDAIAGFDVVGDTSVGAAAANFTLIDARVYTALGGHLVNFILYITTEEPITVTSGNLGDVTCFTLDAAYRPPVTVNTVFGTGTRTGEAILTTSGVVQLRSASDSIADNANLRLMWTYLKP